MGVPTQKRTKSSKKRRASQFALKATKPKLCSNCQNPVLGHTACTKCGYYKGKEAIKIKSALDKKK